MVSINYAFKEIISKIVYYGPGLSGKTTNLQHVFKKVPKDTRGELISLATDADRTLYFDFLPVNVGNIRGFQVKFQLYTVPGQVYYNATRKLVLRGVDGLVFVADSQVDKMDENIESLKNLEENLAEYGYNLNDIPFIIQYNKRDLPNIATVEQLQEQLNPRNIPYYEAVATTGAGVFATLKAISKLVIDKAQKSSSERGESKTAVVAAMDQGTSKPKPQPVAVGGSSQPQQAQAQARNAPYEIKNEPEVASNTLNGERAVEGISHEENKTYSIDSTSSASAGAEIKPEKSVAPESQEITSDSTQGYGELPETATNTVIGAGDSAVENSVPKNDVMEKPAIARDSELMTNVVVSSTPEDTEQANDMPIKEDIEETTEHAALKEETDEINIQKQTVRKHHPDVLDADKLDFLKAKPEKQPKPEPEKEFDQEATVIADPKQTGVSFSKPQMAESKKVKGKKKAGLFGWLKGKKE